MKFNAISSKNIFFIMIFYGIIIITTDVQAHPGRTDSSGCHTCRTNCSSWGLSSGEYHCHRAKTTAPQPTEPIRSKYGENGTGYTEPAPDYKIPKKENSVIKPEITKTEESKPIEKKEIPKAQEVSKEPQESFFTKTTSFFFKLGSKIISWFR